MPTNILSEDNFTDSDIVDVFSSEKNQRVNAPDIGRNKYLYNADRYYEILLRKRGIEKDDPDLADPVTFEVSQVLTYWTLCQVYSDKIDDQRSMFENETSVPNKYINKLKNCKEKLKYALLDLDDGAFKDYPKTEDSIIANTFDRQ